MYAKAHVFYAFYTHAITLLFLRLVFSFFCFVLLSNKQIPTFRNGEEITLFTMWLRFACVFFSLRLSLLCTNFRNWYVFVYVHMLFVSFRLHFICVDTPFTLLVVFFSSLHSSHLLYPLKTFLLFYIFLFCLLRILLLFILPFWHEEQCCTSRYHTFELVWMRDAIFFFFIHLTLFSLRVILFLLLADVASFLWKCIKYSLLLHLFSRTSAGWDGFLCVWACGNCDFDASKKYFQQFVPISKPCTSFSQSLSIIYTFSYFIRTLPHAIYIAKCSMKNIFVQN